MSVGIGPERELEERSRREREEREEMDEGIWPERLAPATVKEVREGRERKREGGSDVASGMETMVIELTAAIELHEMYVQLHGD